MLSNHTMHEITNAAADLARRERKVPHIFTAPEVAVLNSGHLTPLGAIPFIGNYIPAGWERLDLETEKNVDGIAHDQSVRSMPRHFFVDSSGCDKTGRAMSDKRFAELVKPGVGYAVIEAGEFQICIGAFRPASARKQAA